MACQVDRYRMLIERLPYGFAYHRLVVDGSGSPVDYVFLEGNACYEEMTGLRREEVIGKKATAVLPQAGRALSDWIKTCGRVALTGESTRLTRYAEQTEKWYEVTVYSDEPGYFATVLIDITAQKKSEEKARQNESILKAVMDNLPIGIAVNSVHPAVQFYYMNDNFVRFYRTTREALDGPDSFWNAVYEDPDFREALKKRVLADCASGDPSRMVWHDIPITRRGEETTYITAKNIPIPGRPLVISTVWEVTELWRRQEALLKEKREKTLILENLTELVCFVDPEMRIIWANAAAEKVYTVSPEVYLGQKCYAAWQRRSKPCPNCPVRQSLQTGQRCHGEIRSPDGRYWKMTGSPVHDENGNLIGAVYAALNITDLKLAEQELMKLNTELEQRVRERTAELEAANKELDAFAYSVSHDLRAPLRSIDGFSQALLDDYGEQLDGQAQDYLHRVRSACQRMGNLIDDLLKLSRITRREICRDRVDLSALVEKCAQTLLSKEPGRKVKLIIAPGQVVIGDAALLRIALENLLDNAFKFSSCRRQATVEFGVVKKEGGKAFYVKDNGVGFDMAYAGKLFTAFQRLHSPREFPGNGIGLSIVSRIIMRHGGEVWAHGEAGRGATIFFTLPESGTFC